MNPYEAAEQRPRSIHHDMDYISKFREIDDAVRREDMVYMRKHVKKDGNNKMGGPVNLSEDTLLHVLIASEKTKLAVEVLKDIPDEAVLEANHDGDTALHVAARVGDVEIATKLIEKNKALVEQLNKQLESPLHKAALYGERDMFWLLEYHGGNCHARRAMGANVLHCAIMGNAPRLALEIASKYRELMTTRNTKAATPLHLVVTIEDAFRSKLPLGAIEALIYNWIPIEDSIPSHKIPKNDVEKQATGEDPDRSHMKPGEAADNWIGLRGILRYRSRFPRNYHTVLDLLSVACIPAGWIWLVIYRILKQMSGTIELLEQKKRNHKEVLALVEFLAKDPAVWDFTVKGRTGTAPPTQPEDGSMNPGREIMAEPAQTPPEAVQNQQTPNVEEVPKKLAPGKHMKLEELGARILEACLDTKDLDSWRWNESPLTLGARMGLHEFVERILAVCPQSVAYIDPEGMNILQVAIKNGQEKILRILESMATGRNPVLPSWLLSSIDEKTQNTILHFAAEKTVKEEPAAMQMQTELQWFERVTRLVPKELKYSRNESERTAHELFTNNHKDMVKDAMEQLREMGKTCAGLLAAVVFASSFSIPGDKDKNVPVFAKKTAFKIFTHAYVIGLSCASTALVLFLSLLTSPYREKDFRRSLPTKYLFANLSFFLSLLAFLVAFTCNIYLNIYGGRQSAGRDIVPLICELTIFPAVCLFVLLYRGSTFGLSDFLRHVWR